MEKDETEQTKKKKFSDLRGGMFGDYYRTNRELTSRDRARWEKEREEREARGESGKAPWTKREKWMVVACIILVALIILRYFVLRF